MMTTQDERLDPEAAQALDEVRALTEMMRKHADAIVTLADKRRAAIHAMRDRPHPVTYKRIAESMGTTEQTVYRTLRDGITRA